MIETSPKQILLISNLFSVGSSYGGVCKELALKLSENNWRVITTSAVSNRYLRPVDMLYTIWRKRDEFLVAQVDVFSGPAFRWAELTANLLRRLGKPHVLTLHGGNLPDFSRLNPDRVKSLLKSATFVTTPSAYLLDRMCSYQDNIYLLPNPIDIEPYIYRLRARPEPNLLYLRAIHKMYNPFLAIYALQKLRETHNSAKLTMVGPDKGDGALAQLHETIKITHLKDQVSVVGAINKTDVAKTMSQYDIFINTTNVDNTPISVIEAMATGLCIVSTDVGGLPYLLTHEHDALLVPPDDAEAMANAIRRILTEPGLAERLSRNARATAEQFDWSVILPQWETLLLDVIERHQCGGNS